MSLSARLHADRAAKRERQAAKQPHGRMVFNRSTGVKLFHTALAKGMVDDTTQQDQDLLITGPLAQLEQLRTGRLSDEGFIELNEANIAGFCLAAELHKHGTDATRELVAQTKAIFETAADVMADIGERKSKTGRYVLRGGQLEALQESIGMYRQLIEVAPRGFVCRALQAAKEMVNAKLNAIAAKESA